MNIYLAAMEQKDSFAIIKSGIVHNAFLSYYYIFRKKNSYDSNREMFRNNIKRIIIDCGAHSFFANMNSNLSASVKKNKYKEKQSLEEYFNHYIKWVEKNYDYFDYFIELDVGEIVGQEKVLEWRNIIKAKGLYKKCITVMHPRVMSWEDYLKLLDDSESKYIAIESDRKYRKRLPYNKYLKVAYEKGIRVHGFAMTKTDALGVYPFTSVDSSSWKAGAQYGTGKALTKKGFVNVKFKDKKKCMSLPNTIGIHSANKEENRTSRYILAIKAYQKMASHFTDLWKKRGITWKD
jgi:hypothetical protein